MYPLSTLHCTVATLRPFTAGPLPPDARRGEAARWRAVLESARADAGWSAGESVVSVKRDGLHCV